MLVDNVDIIIKAGNGGSGLASFRREKFLPFGGPDGGDGGRGGNIIFVADSNMEDLGVFKHKNAFKAKNGGRGGPNKMHGINAEDLIIKVPVGTSVYVNKSGKELMVSDLQKDGQRVVAAKGGKGGKGNVHFATSTRKAPRIFQPGEQGEEYNIRLRVTLPIDVAILGKPNSGKSSLMTAVSAARPKIAEYPFTTGEPVLGVVDNGVKKYVWAEIPAIVEGSHIGKGLGNNYLGQVKRAAVLVFLIDVVSPDPQSDFRHLYDELVIFDPQIAEKRSVVVLNKIDLIEDDKLLQNIKIHLQDFGLPVYLVSAIEKRGIDGLISAVHGILPDEKKKMVEETQPEVIYRPKPVDRGV